MEKRKKRPRIPSVLLPLGVGAAALLAVTKGPLAEVSEIDAFQRAVTSQSEADALAFMRDFGSSHLVPDLIDLLRPDVALDVCASLSSASSQAPTACVRLQKAVATAPVAGSPTPTTTSSVAVVPPPEFSIPPAGDQQQVVIIPPVSGENRGNDSHDGDANGGVVSPGGTGSGSTSSGGTSSGDSSGGSTDGSSGGDDGNPGHGNGGHGHGHGHT